MDVMSTSAWARWRSATTECQTSLRTSRPLLSTWDCWGTCGGPGVLVRNKPYWWTPKGRFRWTLAPRDLEQITNPRIAGRRWIASRVAWRWQSMKRPPPATPDEVATALGLKAPLSRDGEIAVCGLIREAALQTNEDLAPGFLGPDEWYA